MRVSLGKRSGRFCHGSMCVVAKKNMAFHVMDVTGWVQLGGCHWLDGRVVMAKGHVCYAVNKTWHSPPSLAVGPFSRSWETSKKAPQKAKNNTIKIASF
mgnify:FL=1|jgi:hypothetical protein